MKDGKIEPRYRVTHKDGKPINPAHRLFILSRDTDPYAAPALAFYSQICKATHPQLSEDILRHYDVAPPEPVMLTEEEERTFRSAVNDCPYGLEGDAAMDWFAEHGFALVRTKAVADGA